MLENEYKLSRESLDNAMNGYANFHKNYVPHVMMQVVGITVAEDKTLFAKITH